MLTRKTVFLKDSLSLLLGVVTLMQTVYGKTPSYPTGLLPPDKQALEWGKANLRVVHSRAELRPAVLKTLPARVVNTDYLPNVGLQVYGSCTSWAIVYYYKTWQEAQEHHWPHPNAQTHPERVMSPAFVFNLANAGTPMSGSNVNTNFQYLLDYGTCTCALLDPNADPYTWPTEDEYLASFQYRAKSVARIDTSSDAGLDALKAHLAGGDLAVFSMTLYANFLTYPAGAGIDQEVYFRQDGGTYVAQGAASSGHEMCIIGYDDNKTWSDDEGTTHQGAMLVVNSWGTTWGANLPEAGSPGFFWVSDDYFKAYAADTAIMEDRIGYQPTLVGTYHITHGRAAEVSIDLLGGDRNAPDWTTHVFPQTGGLRPIDATVGFDATDYASNDNLSWWLRISDVSINSPGFVPNATGQVTSFKIKRQDGTIWTSPDTPVQTVETNLTYQYAWANIGLLQRHPSPFDAYTPAISESVWGDLDGDGDEDVIFINCTATSPWVYTAHLYRNDGNWTFTEVNSGIPPIQGTMALGDYDGDGLPDLAMNGYNVNTGTYGTWLFHNQGLCQFRDSGIALPNSTQKIDWIDFNNDGRLDLVLNTYDATWSQQLGLKVLLNQGNGTFTDAGLDLPPIRTYAWADYNRDGLLDVALSVWNGSTMLYQNTGGALTPAATLSDNTAHALAWGDVDNDGWLDLAMTACNGDESQKSGEVLRNNHGTLEPYATFPFVRGGGLAWGDVDNDGLADLCVWGDLALSSSGDRNIVTRVYRNRGDGTFQNLGFNLWGAGSSVPGYEQYVHWVDLDHDGALDLVVCGPESAPYPQPRAFRIYKNSAAQASGLNRPNHSPTTPPGLGATQSVAGGPIDLTWSASSDAETAPGGLFYDLRIGSNPGWSNLLAPDQSIPLAGARLRPTLSASQLGYRLQIPPTGPFYWSVRAIDPAQGVSPWSASTLFTPIGATAPGDVNGDGRVDVADLVLTVQAANGLAPAARTKADRNGDGSVDRVDVETMKAMLLGTAGPDARTLAEKAIDHTGGVVATAGIQLTVPAGALSGSWVIGIEKVEASDVASGRISPRFRITGLPSDFSQPLAITLHADQTPAGTVLAGLGELSLPTSAGCLTPGIRYLPVTAGSGGNYSFQLATPRANQANARELRAMSAENPKAAGTSQGYTLTVDVDLDSHQTVWANSHFSITFDASKVDLANVMTLGTALEDAYNAIKNAALTGGFDTSTRTSWPIQVTVLDMDNSGIYGLFYGSKLGDNHGWIEINSANIADQADVRVTAVHEYFHFVQSLYDPRYAFTKAILPGPQLWVNEAASVWSEALLAPSGYVSPIFNTNIQAPFNGMIAGAQGSSSIAQEHGYGMASLVRYLMLKKGNQALLELFQSLKAGQTPVQAVMTNGPTQTDFSWWPDYVQSLLRGDLYPFGLTDMAAAAPATRQFNIAAATDIEKQRIFAGSLADLSARLHMAIPQYTAFDPKHALACRLARDADDSLMLHLYKAKVGQPTTWLGDGVAANGAWKFEVPDLATLQSQGGWRLLPLVTNKKATDPETGQTPYNLSVAVVGEGTHAFPARTITVNYDGAAFPVFQGSGSLQGRGWADWGKLDLGYFDYYTASVPALPPIDYVLNFTVSITAGTIQMPADQWGEYEVRTVSAIKGYRFELYKGDWDSQPIEINSTTGAFPFTLDRDDISVGGTVYVLYDVEHQRYDINDQLVSQSTEPMEWASFGIGLMP